MDIVRVIESSYNEAISALTMGTSKSALVRARERVFAKTLAARLRIEFPKDDIRIFAAWQRGNASEFGSNRLLFEIAVCRLGTSRTSARKPEEFRFIEEALWQIEIDFSREWRSALHAINRLNCGAAAGKLLVASLPMRGQEQFRNSLSAPAAASSGALYLALVPHPADWDDNVRSPQVWQMREDEWAAMT